MEIKICNKDIFFEDENNAKFIKIVDENQEYQDCDVFVEFVTPSGKFYISEKLEFVDRVAKLPMTSTLTAEYGWLVCQIVATKNGNEYIERFPIKKIFIHESTYGEAGEEVETGLIYKLENTKADDLSFENKKLSLVANEKKIGSEVDFSSFAEKNLRCLSRQEFPNVGKPDILYIAEDEAAGYIWDDKKLIYRCIARNYQEIEIINGGMDNV